MNKEKRVTFKQLDKIAENLSNRYFNYRLRVEKDQTTKDQGIIIVDNGMRGKDVVYVGTLHECHTYIEGVKLAVGILCDDKFM